MEERVRSSRKVEIDEISMDKPLDFEGQMYARTMPEIYGNPERLLHEFQASCLFLASSPQKLG